MNIDNFINANNIRPADAIVVKKEFFGILEHYVIYLGQNHLGEHKFIANYTEGIKIIPVNKILKWLNTYIPVRINHFMGNEIERHFAVERALSRKDENAYNLILNNCESFKNFVHFGINHSEQVEMAGKMLVLGGAAATVVGITNEDEDIAVAGLFAAALGLLTIGLSNQ